MDALLLTTIAVFGWVGAVLCCTCACALKPSLDRNTLPKWYRNQQYGSASGGGGGALAWGGVFGGGGGGGGGDATACAF